MKPPIMTPERQRITIAEACGWTVHHGGKYCMITNCDNGPLANRLFDPLNDLNAMHEAEKTLQFPELYAGLLGAVLLRDGAATNFSCTTVWHFAFAHASAAQRAEAFLKTIEKWKEAKP